MAWLHATTLLLFLGLAAVCDLRTRRIPNRTVMLFSLAALGLAAHTDGLAGLERASLGFAAGVALLLVPFALGFVGAGDAKFMGTVGAFLGPEVTLYAFLAGTILGAPLALPVIRHLRERRATADPSAPSGNADRPPAGRPRGIADLLAAESVPYVVPLALGSCAAVAFQLLVG
jgi:prepilin peptidase CpaA